jgi:hypothetical protein
MTLNNLHNESLTETGTMLQLPPAGREKCRYSIEDALQDLASETNRQKKNKYSAVVKFTGRQWEIIAGYTM